MRDVVPDKKVIENLYTIVTIAAQSFSRGGQGVGRASWLAKRGHMTSFGCTPRERVYLLPTLMRPIFLYINVSLEPVCARKQLICDHTEGYSTSHML